MYFFWGGENRKDAVLADPQCGRMYRERAPADPQSCTKSPERQRNLVRLHRPRLANEQEARFLPREPQAEGITLNALDHVYGNKILK